MELILLTTVAFALGYMLGGWNAIQTFSRILHKLGVTDQQLRKLNESQTAPEPEDRDSVVQIKIEQVGNSLYAYTVDTDTFLAQGSTAEDLVRGLLQRLPKGSKVICSREQGGELIESALK